MYNLCEHWCSFDIFNDSFLTPGNQKRRIFRANWNRHLKCFWKWNTRKSSVKIEFTWISEFTWIVRPPISSYGLIHTVWTLYTLLDYPWYRAEELKEESNGNGSWKSCIKTASLRPSRLIKQGPLQTFSQGSANLINPKKTKFIWFSNATQSLKGLVSSSCPILYND